MNKTCFDHDRYFTGCISCQHDCIEENDNLKQQNAIMREALESISEYWNRDNNQGAMEDACWYAIEKAQEALERVK